MMTAFSTEKNKSSESFILYCPLFAVPLHKISGTRQFESKLSLRSFALSLHKINCTQQNIQASLIFCIRFAFSLHRQPMKVLREPLMRHLLRPRSVTIDDQRRSSIKTPKEHYSKADRRHRATNKTPDTRAVTNAPTIS